jgi:hypothetical protein
MDLLVYITDIVLDYLTVVVHEEKKPCKQNTNYHLTYVNGVLEGRADSYIRGQGRIIRHFRHGRLCGPYVGFFGDSTSLHDLREYGFVYDSRWHGPYILFMHRDKIKSYGQYNDGTPVGVWIVYDKHIKYHAVNYNYHSCDYRYSHVNLPGQSVKTAATVTVNVQHLVVDYASIMP